MPPSPSTSSAIDPPDASRPSIRPVAHETLRARVYEELRSAIGQGKFAMGQAVTVRGLASALGVSPTPVREALQMLTAEGALAAEPNKSYRIPRITRQHLTEVREVRAALEGLAAEKAAESMSPLELARLEQADERALAAIRRQDTKAYLAANEEFHFILYEAARSAVLDRTIRTLWLQIGPALNLLFEDVGLARDMIDNHRRTIAAIKAGDPIAARDAIRRDIFTAAESIGSHLPDGAPPRSR